MELTLIRHAKSSWADAALDDFDRVLNQRGQSDLPIMQEQLIQRGFDPAIVLSSSSARTTLTCEGLGLKAQFRDDLYHASAATILSVVKEHERFQSVVIVGHNPGITEFVNRFCDNANVDNVPTLGISFITADSLEWGKGQLEEFIYPRQFKLG